MTAGAIRVGIGGWDYAPWRETFYPLGLPKARQLEYAASRVSAIEINATYYKLQSRELFERWAAAVPDGFKFAIKGSRYCSNRRRLGEGGEGMARFCGQGFTALGEKLGPILWQLMATKRFEAEDFEAFLDLLPPEQDGVPLRHVVEPRHESFGDEKFLEMVRARGIGIVFSDREDAPSFTEPVGPVAYARLQRARPEERLGYASEELNRWAATANAWAQTPRETYVFMIDGAKERAPAAAMALIERLGGRGAEA